MQLRHVLLASLVSIAACGGGSKKPAPEAPVTTEPATPAPDQAAPAVAEAPAPAPAPPPAPKLELGQVKIVIKSTKKPAERGEVMLAADGTLTAKMPQSKTSKPKSAPGKLSAEGKFTDDKGEVVARLGEGGVVEVRQSSEEKKDGKTVSFESKYVEIGKLDDAGTFTMDDKTISIDDKGKVVGLLPDLQITVTAAPAQKRVAMFLIVTMFMAWKVTSDTSGATAAPATP